MSKSEARRRPRYTLRLERATNGVTALTVIPDRRGALAVPISGLLDFGVRWRSEPDNASHRGALARATTADLIAAVVDRRRRVALARRKRPDAAAAADVRRRAQLPCRRAAA